MIAAFRDLYAEHFANQEIAQQRAVEVPVPSMNFLLQVRDTLAAYRVRLHEQDADHEAAFQVDSQILQIDAFHRSLASDKCPFMKKRESHSYSSKVIVTAVQTCCLLRDSASLEQQMRHSIQLLLPDQAPDLMKAIDKGLIKAPSPSSVSRWRLAVDVDFMYVMRRLVSETADQAVRTLLVDSSPQQNFDWLLIETHTLAPACTSNWTKAVWGLATSREKLLKLHAACDQVNQGHDVMFLEEEIKSWEESRAGLQKELDACAGFSGQPPVDTHICPPTAQGSRRAQLVHKVHALLRTLRLEVGGWPAVLMVLSSVRAVTTDGADADMPLPDMRAMDPGLEMRAGSLILTKLFPLALQVPGALRVLHQSVKELTSAFSAKYAEWFFQGCRQSQLCSAKRTIEKGS